METKSAEETELNNAVNELKALNEKLEQTLAARKQKANGMTFKEKEEDLERMRKSMAQQLADFEVMKKALMRDLQNRCEKVVELEISLDETREQYNNVLRASNNKAQQKKMSVLERNLEQLTNVQKQASKKKLHLLYKSSVCPNAVYYMQLVEQNSQLKKEAALADRKLAARNERIQNLEMLLQEAKQRLLTQNEK